MNQPLIPMGADAGTCTDGVCALPDQAPVRPHFPNCAAIQSRNDRQTGLD